MDLSLADVAAAIQSIHAAPLQFAIEFAGAGAQGLAWLHAVPGSSHTILEATDRYATVSLVNLIGFEPAHFASPQVARAMTIKAYLKARHLAPQNPPVAGLGLTAAIATDRVKRGQHRCCLGVCTANTLTLYHLTLSKGQRTRQQEENLISLIMLRAMARPCGVDDLPQPALLPGETLTEQTEAVDWLAWVLAEEVNWVALLPDRQLNAGDTLPGIALLSGAFNPLHQGHRQLAAVATEILGQPVYFELPLVNADKAPIAPAEAHRRAAQFAGWGTLLFTRTPLFSQKAHLFPHSVFILGIDTVARLIQPRFYHHDPAKMLASFKAIRTAGCRFLVANRLSGDRFLTLNDLDLPVGYRELFEEIPNFRMDISSTTIRESVTPKPSPLPKPTP
jgi:nicotinic acid mononucleotide adenylyltransferase